MLSARSFQTILGALLISLFVLGGVYEALRYWFHGVAALIVLLVAGKAYHDLRRRLRLLQKKLDYEQVRSRDAAITNLSSTVAEVHSMTVVRQRFPEADLPTTSWSMRFSNLHLIAQLLDQYQPTTIVEFGSGLSTVCIASWLKQRGRGRIISIDHDEAWAEIARQHLQRHDLAGYATIECAPLTPRRLSDGRQVVWYGDQFKESLAGLEIDFVVVDGPPAGGDGMALNRLPALEVVAPYLTSQAVVCLDDAHRPGEKQVVAEWISALGDARDSFWPSATGLSIISRCGPRRVDKELAVASF